MPCSSAEGWLLKLLGWSNNGNQHNDVSRTDTDNSNTSPGETSSGVAASEYCTPVEAEAWHEAVKSLFSTDYSRNRTVGVDAMKHVQQSFAWDCGLACLEMIFSSWGLEHVSRDVLVELAATQSTWTIDLLFVLHSVLDQQESNTDIAYLFSSQSLGVNGNLQTLPYYATQFTKDTCRVQERSNILGIGQDTNNNFSIQRHVAYPLSEILQYIQYQGCVAILLVHGNMLSRGEAQARMSATDRHSCCPYTGHYVLLVGVVEEGAAVLVHDPNVEQEQRILTERLERAWHATGTDADVILVVHRK